MTKTIEELALEAAREVGGQIPVRLKGDDAVIGFIHAFLAGLAEQSEPVYQVWRSTDPCLEFYFWDDCDKHDYDRAKEDGRRILYTIRQGNNKKGNLFDNELCGVSRQGLFNVNFYYYSVAIDTSLRKR